jgi:NAD(P)-dependent dehydrogenase (short-subunit alcohol dehydrogenase family)
MIPCEDKVVVVTGASRGLGAGMARRFAERGLKLGLCSRSAPVSLLDVSPERVVCSQVDVRDEAGLRAFTDEVVTQHGAIDLWINNAGVLDPVVFARDLDPSALMDHLAINVGGVLSGSRAFIQHRAAVGRGGVLINISSGAALKGYAGWGAYCASKAAVDRLTECIQLEEAEAGLRAYAVAPGIIDTDMQTAIRSMTAAQFPMVEKFIELKRQEAFSTPSFIADRLLAIAFDEGAKPESVVLRLPTEKPLESSS